MPAYKFNLNGQEITTPDVDADTPLLWVLRDSLELRGTKFGCGKGLCGACTIHLNGNATRSCILPIVAVQGQNITTIEGLASGEDLHPLQQAWIDLDVPQCGYCQAGQLMTAAALLKTTPNPSDEQIDQAMAGNLCRCGTYVRIKKGIKQASGQLAPKEEQVADLFYEANSHEGNS